MNEQPDKRPGYEQLRSLAELREQPFTSDVPIVGGLIVWFRTAWNNVSTQWYVRPLADQQSTFNSSVVDALEQESIRLQAVLTRIDSQVSQIDDRVVAQDRDQVHTTHDLGDLSAQVRALRGAVEALEARLVELEGGRD